MKCQHKTYASYTFKDGKTIECCHDLNPVSIDGQIKWYEPCKLGDEHRRTVLCLKQ